MNKSSAIAIAGGVTGALISGVAGYSIRIHQPTTEASADPAKPIVKTQTRTITIHRKPKKAPAAVVVRRAPTLSRSGVASSPSLHQTGGSSVASGEQEIEHDDDAGGGYEDD
jgi:hypothetical protein